MDRPDWYAPPGTATSVPNPTSTEEPSAEPAGFGIRAGAYFIDVLVNSATAFVAGGAGGGALAVLAALGVVPQGWEHRVGRTSLLAYVFSSLAALAYHTLAEGLGGATVGKVVCGLRVLSEDRQPCTVTKALVRGLAYYIDVLFFGLVAWSSMSKSPMKQRYGDRWAKTIVVHARSLHGTIVRSPALGILVALLASGAVYFVNTMLKGF